MMDQVNSTSHLIHIIKKEYSKPTVDQTTENHEPVYNNYLFLCKYCHHIKYSLESTIVKLT